MSPRGTRKHPEVQAQLLIDARTLPADARLETQVCIVGAGAAGITLALELAGGRLDVCLVESGGLEGDAETQALAAGEIAGRAYYPLQAARLRYFGGTTNHWAGNCRPLDADDFELRPWIAGSGWPFPRRELDPFYARAAEVCQLRPSFALEDWTGSGPVPLDLDPTRAEHAVFQRQPTRFGRVYREAVLGAENIRTLGHANLIELALPTESEAVSHASFGTLEGGRFQVAARVFVLATGGIENARLLLASRSTRPRGLGNDHDLVGRNFMEHPGVSYGVFVPSRADFDVSFYGEHELHDQTVRAVLTLPEPVRRANQLLAMRLSIQPAWSEDFSEGVESFKRLRRAFRGEAWPDDFAHHLWNVVRDLDDVAGEAYARWQGPPRAYQLFAHGEQTPNPESRVTLGDDLDPLGVPRARLDWRIREQDLESIRRSMQLLASEFGRAGVGRVKLQEDDGAHGWEQFIYGQFHHCGTTRMADDPRQGVVDRHGRVHGLANLYVTGGSVFPTEGHANPTFTIVALAARLAARIKEVAT